MAEKPSLPRILVLDNLRGLSAIYVVAFHTAFVPYPQLYIPAILKNLATFGSTGVYLFFIISGFSLTLTMPRHSTTLGYAISRLFRIAPLFYALLIPSLARDWRLFQIHHSLWEILANVFFVFNFFPRYQEGIVPASWTIGVEMIYYCVFPIFYRLTSRTKLFLVAGLVAFHCSLIFILGGSGVLRLLIVGFVPLFLFGEMAFRVVSTYHHDAHVKQWAPVGTICGIGLLSFCIMHAGEAQPFRPGINAEMLRIVSGLAYGLLLVGLVLRPLRIINNRILGFYGKISYSLYLCHPAIVYALSNTFQRIYKVIPGGLAYLVCACLALLIVTGIATLTYQFIEKPFIRLGNKLSNSVNAWITSRRAALPVS